MRSWVCVCACAVSLELASKAQRIKTGVALGRLLALPWLLMKWKKEICGLGDDRCGCSVVDAQWSVGAWVVRRLKNWLACNHLFFFGGKRWCWKLASGEWARTVWWLGKEGVVSAVGVRHCFATPHSVV